MLELSGSLFCVNRSPSLCKQDMGNLRCAYTKKRKQGLWPPQFLRRFIHTGDLCWSPSITYRFWLCWREDTVPSKYDFCIIIIRDTSQHFRPSSDENITTSDRWHRGKCAGGCRNHREMTVFCGSRGTELTITLHSSFSQPQSPGILGLWARNLKTTIQEPCQQL